MNITLTQPFFANATNMLKHFPKAYPDIFDFMEEVSKNPKAGDHVPGYSKLFYKIRTN